jgi:hypothetical protein
MEIMEREITPYLQLMKGLPPLVSVALWVENMAPVQ